MKSKGFTLIELLAVIVILAIIALIATPIVLGIIEDSRVNSNKLSAGYIIDTVEKAYSLAYTLNGGLIPELSAVKAEFSMSNAVWYDKNLEGENTPQIRTTGDEVYCDVIVTEVEDGGTVGALLSVSCPQFPDVVSETYELAASKASPEVDPVPEG